MVLIGCLDSKLIQFLKFLPYRPYFPHEFSRNQGPLKNWTIEFRSLLLHSGPFCLAGVLPKRKLRHFSLLHAAIYILELDPKGSDDWVDYVESLISKFIDKVPLLQGSDDL